MPISDATREDAERLVQRYPVARAALLPLLHLVQSDEGHVSDEGIAFCAETVGVTRAEAAAVATFYTMYKRAPFGDYLLSVCTNPTCKIAGGREIYEGLVEACGGRVDRDGSGVMVEHVECLAICDAAPVVQVNYEMYGPVTRDEALDLLARAKAGDPPPSNRSGHTPGTFRAGRARAVRDRRRRPRPARRGRACAGRRDGPARVPDRGDRHPGHPPGRRPVGHGGRAHQDVRPCREGA
jgi:NADH-quinone oxidoreductase subunit E